MDFPLTNRNIARRMAQIVVGKNFDARCVGKEIGRSTRFAMKLMEDMLVQSEVQIIMNRTERNATKFLDKMWEWLENESVEKADVESRLTAARILAKGYISENAAKKPTMPKMEVTGLEEGIGALTGDKQVM